MRKNPLQQLLIHASKIYALGKSSSVSRNFAHGRDRADTALMQMYEKEGIYKSGYDNLGIV
jgi:hypothetical protein